MRSAEPLVGVVALNWHGRDETLKCLDALSRLAYSSWFLVLLDNGCHDFSPDEVGHLIPGARYLHSESNLGFAGGANLGMREALDAGAKYVWFLNNDARPEPEALRHLIGVAQGNSHTGIVGAKILRAADPHRLDSIALHVNRRSGRIYLMGHDEEDRGQYDDLDQVVAVTACAMLVTREACEHLGGFDETFFAYVEDADLCLRAAQSGIGVAVAPRARVLHARPPATQARQSASSIYYTTRNQLMLMQRHGSGGTALRIVRSVFIAVFNTVYALRAGGSPLRTRVSAVWRGVRDYRRGVLGRIELGF